MKIKNLSTTHLRLAKQRGYLVILLTIMIVVVGFIAAVSVNIFYSSAMSTTVHDESDVALYLAEAGIEHATHKMLEPTIADRQSCTAYNSTPLTNTFGAGDYSVAASNADSDSLWPGIYYAGANVAPTTLSSALTATSTSIPVASTTNYAPAGRIMIDNERIDYQGTTSTSFTNLIRGADGTLAAAHASGTAIGQNQCNIISTAGVPNLTTPAGKRVLNASVEMQDGFAVGDANSNGLTILNFNYPLSTSANNWNSQGQSGSTNLYGTFWLSNADGWFVGSNFIEHWNRYTGTTYTPPVNVNYRSIYCTASNACHAVGDVLSTDSTHQVILDWNGSTWTRTAATGQNIGSNLKSVNCDSSTDCWAVGDPSGGNVFYHWTGAAPWTGITENLAAYTYNGVFCNATNDCWAVGSGATFARLTSGTAWTDYPTGLTSTQYNSIFCNSSTDCWAVGNASGSTTVFAHWNGSAWSLNSSTPSPASNLYGVSCYNTNDCWAVGSATSGNTPQLFHWDGNSWTTNSTISGTAVSTATLRSIDVVGGASSQPLTNWSESVS